MSEKTIMKLYANGNLETLGVQLQQIPSQLNNLFVKENAIDGFLNSSGGIEPTTSDGDKISEFIPVSVGQYTLRVTWNHTNPDNLSYYTVGFFNSNRGFISRPIKFEQTGVANQEEIIEIPSGVAYVRISITFLDTSDVVFGRETGVFSFRENTIIVPTIAQYPPEQQKNYFVDRKSVEGYITSSASDGYLIGDIKPTSDYERASDFISVDGWGTASIRVEFIGMDNTVTAYNAIALYGETKNYLSFPHRGNTGVNTGNHVFQRQVTIPQEAKFLRISSSYYDKTNVTVKICVMRGSVTIPQHYEAFEDTYPWAVDTGNPISIFPQGIFIKGRLIQTNT